MSDLRFNTIFRSRRPCLADKARIVNFIAEDTDETGVPYAGVIPFEKALDPFGDAILPVLVH